jgi:hypothetical protein
MLPASVAVDCVTVCTDPCSSKFYTFRQIFVSRMFNYFQPPAVETSLFETAYGEGLLKSAYYTLGPHWRISFTASQPETMCHRCQHTAGKCKVSGLFHLRYTTTGGYHRCRFHLVSIFIKDTFNSVSTTWIYGINFILRSNTWPNCYYRTLSMPEFSVLYCTCKLRLLSSCDMLWTPSLLLVHIHSFPFITSHYLRRSDFSCTNLGLCAIIAVQLDLINTALISLD